MSCPLIPLGDRVVMKRENLKTVVIVPEQYRRRNAPMKGVVVAKGPACEWPIEIGKTYLHGQYAGSWFNAKGTVTEADAEAEFYILSEGDLVAEVAHV